ncbi:MAG: MFS transporter [Candidatus Bathyarchaeota archaeon]
MFLSFYSGVGFYAFGIFFKPIQEEFNWSRGVTSFAFTMLYLVQAVSSPFIGKLTDGFGPKRVIIVGAIITSLGLTLLSLTSSLLFFYSSYAVTGLGLSAIGLIPISSFVSNWFIKKRGLAIGIAASGVGVGGLVLAPIIGDFLIPTFGWRATYQILAIMSGLFILVLAHFVLKPNPHDFGLHPDGEISETEMKISSFSSLSEGWKLEDALRCSTFWLIVGAFIMFNIGQVGTIQHLVSHLTDIGFPTSIAVSTISLIGLGSTIGKFFFGFISDKLSAKYCTATSFALTLIATIILIVLTPVSHPVLTWVFALMFGLGIGGWAPLASVLTSQNFGLTYYGTIYGIVSLFHNVSTGMGPIFFGYIYDTSKSYDLAFTASLILYSAATVFILVLQRPRLSSIASRNPE